MNAPATATRLLRQCSTVTNFVLRCSQQGIGSFQAMPADTSSFLGAFLQPTFTKVKLPLPDGSLTRYGYSHIPPVRIKLSILSLCVVSPPYICPSPSVTRQCGSCVSNPSREPLPHPAAFGPPIAQLQFPQSIYPNIEESSLPPSLSCRIRVLTFMEFISTRGRGRVKAAVGLSSFPFYAKSKPPR